MNSILKDILKSLVISLVVLAAIFPVSCKVTEQGIVLVNTNDYVFPKLDSYYVTGEKSLRLVFSEKVNLDSCILTPEIFISEKRMETSEGCSGLCFYDLEFAEKFAVGADYKFYGEVTDRIGNTLSFSVPFTGFNGSLPEMEITEVHPRYTSSKLVSGVAYKCEYIELLVKKAGNLAGLELYSANDGSEKSYKFPAIEVSENEIILVHLRTKEEGSVSELGTDLAISTARYSSNAARDLWQENENSRLGNEMDVILLRNTRDSAVLDAFCYAPSSALDWKSVEMSEAVLSAVSAGLWDSDSVSSAVCSDGMTATKSFVKIAEGLAAGKNLWELSKTSGETPGVLDFSH